jgi:predicted AAA+ superfamily ATPase
MFFWSSHNHAKLDLLIVKDDKKIGFEFKYGQAPQYTRTMAIVEQDLKLDAYTVIYPGEVTYPLTETINVMGLKEFLENLKS